MQVTASNPHADFLRADIALCFTFCKVAETNYKIGHTESAEEAIRNAETGYGTVERFLSDGVHSKGLKSDELQLIQEEHRQLRERLDELQCFRESAGASP